VDSRPGSGTKITVYFPASDTKAIAAKTRTPRDGAALGGWETILVVEDESDLRRAAKRVLEQVGYQVLTAADGLEALEAIRGQSSPIDLVMSDLVMPRLGGRALYDAVRRDGKATPFLFVSGYSPGDDRGNLPPEFGVPVLDKPWTPIDLLARVRQILDQQ
jgi:hypothetical protein